MSLLNDYKTSLAFAMDVQWSPTDRALPMKRVASRSRPALWAACGLATAFTGVLLSSAQSGAWIARVMMIAIGSAAFVFCLRDVFTKESVTISEEDVAYEKRSPWNATGWKEPLSGYDGIVALRYIRIGGFGAGPAPVARWVIILEHENERKSIPLYRTGYQRTPEFDEKLAAFSQLLKLPIVDDDKPT